MYIFIYVSIYIFLPEYYFYLHVTDHPITEIDIYASSIWTRLYGFVIYQRYPDSIGYTLLSHSV